MKRRMLSLLLALVMVAGMMPTSFAADEKAEEAANVLYDLGLFKGTGTNADGTPIFALDRTPNRAEAVTMLVRLLGKENVALSGTWETPFTDVPAWAEKYVGYAYQNGLTKGTSQTTFGSNEDVTASQYITFVLRALGYDSSTDFAWDKAWELSDHLGITDKQYNNDNSFRRGDAAVISSSALEGKTQKGAGDTLLDALVASGAVSKEAAERYGEPTSPEKVALYSKDGRVVQVESSTVAEYLSKGWLREPYKGYVVEKTYSPNWHDLSPTKLCWEYGNGMLLVDGSGVITGWKDLENSLSNNGIRADAIKNIYVKVGTEELEIAGFNDYSALERVELSDTVVCAYGFDAGTVKRIGIPNSVTDGFGVFLYMLGGLNESASTVLYCENNSPAEKYAQENNLKYMTATPVYALDGRQCMVTDAEKPQYLASGWYTTPQTAVTLYDLAGNTCLVTSAQVSSYKAAGWYETPVQKLYNTAGETIVVSKSEVQAKRSQGWYTEPVQTLYAGDGRSMAFAVAAIPGQLQQGWYTFPVQTVYSADGKTAVIGKGVVDQYQKKGWYTYPVMYVYRDDGSSVLINAAEKDSYVKAGWSVDANITMYALDGRTASVPKADVEKYQAVGWYLYADYVCAKADELANSDGYAAAVSFIEGVISETQATESCYETFIKKRESLRFALQKRTETQGASTEFGSWLTQEQQEKITQVQEARRRKVFLLSMAQNEIETFIWGGKSMFPTEWRQLFLNCCDDVNSVWQIVKNDLDIYDMFGTSDYADLWIYAQAIYEAYSSGKLKESLPAEQYENMMAELSKVANRLGVFFSSKEIADSFS